MQHLTLAGTVVWALLCNYFANCDDASRTERLCTERPATHLVLFLLHLSVIRQVLDERDALLRNQLGSVKDGSSELAALTAEAEKLIKDARSEVSAMVNSKKSEKQAELDKVYNDAKMKVRYLLCYIVTVVHCVLQSVSDGEARWWGCHCAWSVGIVVPNTCVRTRVPSSAACVRTGFLSSVVGNMVLLQPPVIRMISLLL
jgi:hypothetical protein